jgi:RNA polymerase sigma factor (sigma-70 family)
VELVSGEDFPADQARRALVLDALQRLSTNERAVVALRYYLDLSEIQTAQQLRMPTGTVKSTLARALGKLRADPTLKRGATAEETT